MIKKLKIKAAFGSDVVIGNPASDNNKEILTHSVFQKPHKVSWNILKSVNIKPTQILKIMYLKGITCKVSTVTTPLDILRWSKHWTDIGFWEEENIKYLNATLENTCYKILNIEHYKRGSGMFQASVSTETLASEPAFSL